MGVIVLLRHGETDWSRDGRHTGTTDIPLTAVGERQAAALAPDLRSYRFAAAFSSPRQRALRTAALAGLPTPVVDDDLAEWDYGGYEGITTDQIQRDRPGWNLWEDGVPDGETVDEVGARADRVLDRIRPLLRDADVALAGHGHALRVLAARWIELDPRDGARLRLSTGTLSVLGTEHGRPAIDRWNLPPAPG